MPHNTTNAPVPRPDVLTRPKLEGGRRFVMHSEFQPAGDQPTAIAELSAGIAAGERDQVLLGATGTGKTYTMSPPA
jgi:excinuclease ABC subunit B